MTIGTAKPTAEQLNAVPHYFIDHLGISEAYSAGRYAEECAKLLEGLFAHHDLVFLVGGAGMYIRSVIEGFHEMPYVPPAVRKKWENLHATAGITVLQEAIQQADPEFAQQVDLQNHRRLVRALSLIDISGTTVTALREQAREAIPYQVVRIFCNLPREMLYTRIHDRVDAMIEDGLVDEVKALVPHRDAQALQTVGYAEILDYLDGRYSLDEAIAKIKQHSCNYAKRQLTWFRNQGDWQEFNPPDEEAIITFIHEITGL
jgi:tRNA dimethylallyltransferase